MKEEFLDKLAKFIKSKDGCLDSFPSSFCGAFSSDEDCIECIKQQITENDYKDNEERNQALYNFLLRAAENNTEQATYLYRGVLRIFLK